MREAIKVLNVSKVNDKQSSSTKICLQKRVNEPFSQTMRHTIGSLYEKLKSIVCLFLVALHHCCRRFQVLC